MSQAQKHTEEKAEDSEEVGRKEKEEKNPICAVSTFHISR